MLKVVVYDGDSGGEAVADFLADELQILDVVRVIDWEHAPYEDKSITEICRLADRCLKPYIGKSDLIILGGYTVALAVNYLQARYHKQKFLCVGVNYYRILKSRAYPERITVMMNNALIESTFCDELRRELPYSTIVVPDCSGWEELSNTGQLSKVILRQDLETYFELSSAGDTKARRKLSSKPLLESILEEKERNQRVSERQQNLIASDLVLLLNTNLWRVHRAIEEVFGYKVKVMDFRQKLLHDTCATLNLLGTDGRRSK